MPIYAVKCPDCHHTFEKLAKVSELIECPKCGAATKRLLTAPNFKVNGAGAYSNSMSKPVDSLSKVG